MIVMLRYLQASLKISHFHTIMKSTPKPIKSSRVIPILSRVFPHKLKFLSHASLTSASRCRNIHNGSVLRKFSTRSGRTGPRPGSGQEVRAVNSLADDEADLSDWVDGLATNASKKTQLYSDTDNEIDNGRKNYGFGKGRGRDREMEDSRDEERRGGTGFEKFKRSKRGGEGGSGDRFSSEGSRGAERFGDRMEGLRSKRIGAEEFEMESRGGREMRRGERSERSNIGRGGISSSEKVDTPKWGYAFSDEGRGGISSSEKVDAPKWGNAFSDEDKTIERNEFKGFEIFKELMGSDEEENDESGKEEDVDPINKETVLAWRQKEDDEKISPPSSPSSAGSYLSQTRFDQVSISPATMKALKDIGYEKMTVVQEATLPVIMKGKDVMAKARTGTGKTVAFLLPSIEVIEKSPPVFLDQRRPPIIVLILCPTRELACQAAAEADKLLKYHPSLGVQVVIGGTRLALEQKRMRANPCQMLVATPGRLKDHIENTSGFRIRLSGVKVLVLDEADHLLDMGFRKDIERIVEAVPKKRQTLLFSATIPTEVKQMCHVALRRDYEYINTVQEGSEETHTQVLQTHLVATMDDHFPLLYTLLKEHIADNVDYKVLVFCTTAMVTRLIAELLAELKLNVREIHSRKSQSYRTKVSDEFRNSKGLILVTSDVSARGVDYPDVTLVVQLGIPADRQQYIHRLGRTGRKGKEGQGILLLAPWEEFFLSTIKDLPITKASVPVVDQESKKRVQRALCHLETKDKESAYQAWLGYYNSSRIGKDKFRLVELANQFSRTMGLDIPPALPAKVLVKMGLRNIPGLRFN